MSEDIDYSQDGQDMPAMIEETLTSVALDTELFSSSTPSPQDNNDPGLSHLTQTSDRCHYSFEISLCIKIIELHTSILVLKVVLGFGLGLGSEVLGLGFVIWL